MRGRSTLRPRPTALLVAAAVLSGLLGACEEYGLPAGAEPHRELNFLDMGDQPKGKAQRGDLVGGPDFNPSPGAVPRGFTPYPYADNPELAASRLENPLPAADPNAFERGQLVFERFCVPCHDAKAGGKGTVIEKGFPAPPSLMTEKVRDWKDGRIFHVVTMGQNIMPSYASQILERDRWAVIRYLRRLQSTQPIAPAPPGATSAAPPSSAAPPASAVLPSSAAPPASAAPPSSAASPSSSAVLLPGGPPLDALAPGLLRRSTAPAKSLAGAPAAPSPDGRAAESEEVPP
jgi:mono/diheme cytochrome c family protein